jgi:outer membrane protein TolC
MLLCVVFCSLSFAADDKDANKAAQEQLNASKSDYYPGIVVTGGYLAANIPNFLTISNALNIGLGLQYHMESLCKTKSKIAQSQAKINQITAMQGNLDDKIRLQINEAYQSYVLLSNKLKVYEESVKQATENYRICNNKYSNNVLTTSELLDADVAKLQAELQYAFAKIDVLPAYKKLQYRSGILVSNK